VKDGEVEWVGRGEGVAAE
jgi:hypothetical protein